jgi:hypothetical protein
MVGNSENSLAEMTAELMVGMKAVHWASTVADLRVFQWAGYLAVWRVEKWAVLWAALTDVLKVVHLALKLAVHWVEHLVDWRDEVMVGGLVEN